MKISLLCPTRERPNWMERVWNSACDTANEKDNLEIVYYIDGQDEDFPPDHAGLAQFEKIKSDQVKAFIGRRYEYFGRMFNKAYEISTGEICMLCADDLLFKTEGWDTAVREAFLKYPDRIALVWAGDGICNEALPTHPFLSRAWADTVGYFACPYLLSASLDIYVFQIAKGVGRAVYLDKVMIQHLHWSHVTGEVRDKTSSYRYKYNELNGWLADELKFEKVKAAEKLQKYIKDFKEKN